jgi:hypothetical protein
MIKPLAALGQTAARDITCRFIPAMLAIVISNLYGGRKPDIVSMRPNMGERFCKRP